jgi:hypothetical protein
VSAGGRRGMFDNLVAKFFSGELEREAIWAELADDGPWRWYCRTCGTTGDDPDPGGRDWEAGEHLRTTACGRHEVTGFAEYGREMHVWTYPLAVAPLR